jgi:hypothetical protein
MIQVSRDHYENDILPILNKTRVQLVKELNRPAVENMARRELLYRQTDELINAAYQQLAEVDRAKRIEVARFTSDRITNTLNDEVPTIAKTLSLERLIRIADRTVFGSEGNKHTAGYWWRRQEKYLQELYKNTVDGLIAADTSYSEIVRAIRGTRENRYTDGIMNATYRQAKALARSSVINVNNQARLDVYESNRDLVKGVFWNATFDSRTTQICISLDGKAWTIPDYEPINHSFGFPGATAHFACRSTQVTILKSYEELNGINQEKVKNAGKQSQFTGREPQDMSWKTFMAKQPASFQDKVLGKTRGKLYREGKINLDDLINKDFEPVKIKDLDV